MTLSADVVQNKWMGGSATFSLTKEQNNHVVFLCLFACLSMFYRVGLPSRSASLEAIKSKDKMAKGKTELEIFASGDEASKEVVSQHANST